MGSTKMESHRWGTPNMEYLAPKGAPAEVEVTCYPETISDLRSSRSAPFSN